MTIGIGAATGVYLIQISVPGGIGFGYLGGIVAITC